MKSAHQETLATLLVNVYRFVAQHPCILVSQQMSYCPQFGLGHPGFFGWFCLTPGKHVEASWSARDMCCLLVCFIDWHCPNVLLYLKNWTMFVDEIHSSSILMGWVFISFDCNSTVQLQNCRHFWIGFSPTCVDHHVSCLYISIVDNVYL